MNGNSTAGGMDLSGVEGYEGFERDGAEEEGEKEEELVEQQGKLEAVGNGNIDGSALLSPRSARPD